MQSTFFIKSQRANTYLVNIQKKSILLVHPLIAAIHYGYTQSLSSVSYADCNYYTRKLAYYRKHNLISESLELTSKPLEITPGIVEESIANTGQIVFETTERCNLRCKYCFYEDFYDTRTDRVSSHLPTEKAHKIIDLLLEKLGCYNNSSESTIYISFYGGEPLLNAVLISETIDYCKKIDPTLRKPKYTITTNGTLLHKHIELLIKNNFRITVSLDGNKANNSYRSFPNKKNSFDSIMANLQLVRDRYPDYFKNNIVFNAVLHNRNSVEQIYDFYKTHFDTVPTILELNNSGIKDEKVKEFNEVYQSKEESLQASEIFKKTNSEMTLQNPSYHSAALFLHQYLWFVYKTYRHQLLGEKIRYLLSTGTCLPFSKKIFITADGKILPCEKIAHEHVLGYVTDKGVSIDCQAIADKYNKAISRLSRQCKSCYKQFACEQCLFFTGNENPVCYAYMNESGFAGYLKSTITFIEEHPKEYHVIMKDILFN